MSNHVHDDDFCCECCCDCDAFGGPGGDCLNGKPWAEVYPPGEDDVSEMPGPIVRDLEGQPRSFRIGCLHQWQRADEAARADILAFHDSDGPEKIRQLKKKDEDGTPTASDLNAALKPDIDELLDDVQVHDEFEDPSLDGWFAVSTGGDGVVAFFKREVDAYRFRLDLINRIMNP